MEKYINQLIADLQAAQKPEGVSVYPEHEYNQDMNTTMVQLTGIAHKTGNRKFYASIIPHPFSD
jgi:hypothetical protein